MNFVLVVNFQVLNAIGNFGCVRIMWTAAAYAHIRLSSWPSANKGAHGSGRRDPNLGPARIGLGLSLRLWYKDRAWT